jgi:outer membrane protein TolC
VSEVQRRIRQEVQLPQGYRVVFAGESEALQQASGYVRQARAAVGVATAARQPQLAITVAYGGGATTFARMFSAGNVTWDLGANLLAPLLNDQQPATEFEARP